MSEIQFDDRMSDADALMWTIEKDPLLRSTITSVAVFDRSLDRDRFREAIDRTTRMVPRLRQRVQSNPLSIAPPRWEVDPNFDLDFHVRWLRPAAGGSLRDVLDLAEPIAMQGFDRARPLWEVDVVEGLDEGRSALILKLHHAITDGVGGIKLAMHLFDLDRDGTERGELPPEPPVHVMNQLERMVDAFDHERRRALGIARRAGTTLAGAAASVANGPSDTARRFSDTVASVGRMLAPATRPLSDVLTDRSLSVRFEVLRLPVGDLKAAARAADGKLNDAFVAGAIGGLRRYHLRRGSAVPRLRMTMPINIRTDETSDVAGNQFAPARFPVPLDIDDPAERMRTIRALVVEQRGEPALSLLEPMSGIVRRLPTGVSTGLFGSMLRGVDFVTSNVPGVPIPVFLAGARMEAQFPFGPMAGAAANITLLSYLDEAQIGINFDPAAVTDPDVFIECLQDGYDEVLKLGSPVEKTRRSVLGVHVDVAVVGGGPAGAAAAITLARAGRRVALVDKANFPRDKCCGDGLTTGALRLLEQLGLDPATVPSWQPVDDIVVRSPSGHEVTFPLPRDRGRYAVVARRVDLDAALLDLARRAGVEIHDGHALKGLTQDATSVTLTVDGLDDLTATHVIGADGMWSPTRKLAGAGAGADPGEPYLGEWHAFRQYFTGVTGRAATELFIWFEPDLLPGYAWSFPLPGGGANVGFGIARDGGKVERVQAMKALWPDLLARPHIAEVLGAGATAESPHKAWPIPARIDRMPRHAGRVLFAGDAVAADDVMTGEGIGQALLTGILAAEAILGGGDVAPRYDAAVDRHLVADHRMSALLQRALQHRKGARFAVRLAGANAWTRRNFARWLFEDYPRAVVLTPRRWRRKLFTGPGAYEGSPPRHRAETSAP